MISRYNNDMNKNRGMDMEEQPKKDKVYTTTWWNIIQIIILLAWVCSVFLKIRSDINQARTIDKAIERIEREASERESERASACFCLPRVFLFQVGGQAVLGRQNISPTPWLTKRHG